MLTLYEASKIAPQEVIRNSIIEHFARSSDILRAMRWMDVQGGAYRYNLEGTLPGIAFRGIGEGYSESTGVINPQTEALCIAGGDLDVDRATIAFTSEDARSRHELMKAKALALSVGATIINGDSTANINEFDGLRKRITGDQIIDAGATDGGDALSVSALRDLVDQVENPTHLIMSKKMRGLLTTAASDINIGGFITRTEDEFGKRLSIFDDLPILVADKDGLDNQIIGFNEVGAGGATATASSIYCVSMADEGVVGLQNGIMDVRDLGENYEKPGVRTRVEWYVAMAVQHGQAAARLRGIKNAAVTK